MASSYTVNIQLDSVAKSIGEGPFWQAESQVLYFVSIMDGEVHLWSEPNDYHDTIQVGENPGDSVSFVIPCEKGGFLVGVNKSIVHVDWQNGVLQRRTLHVVDPDEPIRFNDAKCDPRGRLVAGTMSLEQNAAELVKPDAGVIYGIDLDGSIKKLDGGFGLSNGLGWHGGKFYFTDSVARIIYSYDWDDEGFAVSNKQVAVDFAKLEADGAGKLGIPDGLAVDTDGNLWVACFFDTRVLCIDPVAGKILRHIDLPVSNITSCCFGGENHADLFVTTANRWGRNSDEIPPHAGSVFRITGLGVRGTESVHFKGNV